MDRIKSALNYPVLTVDTGLFLYLMGIFTGISVGFLAGRV